MEPVLLYEEASISRRREAVSEHRGAATDRHWSVTAPPAAQRWHRRDRGQARSAEQETQNWNGSTETDNLPSVDCCMVKFTSLVALRSPTLTERAPLHFSVSLSLLVDVVTILWPSWYRAFLLSALFDGAVEFLAA